MNHCVVTFFSAHGIVHQGSSITVGPHWPSAPFPHSLGGAPDRPYGAPLAGGSGYFAPRAGLPVGGPRSLHPSWTVALCHPQDNAAQRGNHERQSVGRDGRERHRGNGNQGPGRRQSAKNSCQKRTSSGSQRSAAGRGGAAVHRGDSLPPPSISLIPPMGLSMPAGVGRITRASHSFPFELRGTFLPPEGKRVQSLAAKRGPHFCSTGFGPRESPRGS